MVFGYGVMVAFTGIAVTFAYALIRYQPRLLAGTLVIAFVAAEVALPPQEGSVLASQAAVNNGWLTYGVPFSGGQSKTCPLLGSVALGRGGGAPMLLKRTPILGLCWLEPMPPGWVEPKFDEWRTIT